MEDNTKDFKGEIIVDALSVVISFLPERLLYRTLCKNVNTSIISQVTHLVVKNEKKLMNIMILFPNIRFIHFENDQMDLEEIKKVFYQSTFPNLEMLDLSLYDLKKEDEDSLSCVPFCWKGKQIKKITTRSQKDVESLFYISLGCFFLREISLVWDNLKNPRTRLVNYPRIYNILLHLQKKYNCDQLFNICPFMFKVYAEILSSQFFTNEINNSIYSLNGLPLTELKEQMDCNFLIDETVKSHSIIGLNNLIQIKENIFDDIGKLKNRLLEISKNEEFFDQFVKLSKIPEKVFFSNEFSLLMKSFLIENNIAIIIKFTKLGFRIYSLAPEFEQHLLQLLKESKFDLFYKYFSTNHFHRCIKSLNAHLFVDIIESKYMNLKMEKNLFEEILKKTEFFKASCIAKKSWVWDYIDGKFSLFNQNEKIKWMEHVSVNCEEFDNLVIKNFNLDTLFSIIDRYRYIPLALFNMKSFDEALFKYIKKNYTSFEKLKSLEYLGYNIQRIGTLKEVSLSFDEVQAEIIRNFFDRKETNFTEKIQKENFEEIFDYEKIEFEYEDIYSEDEEIE
jgi:hypothetical protein